MIDTTIIFPIAAGILIIVDIMLIIAVFNLTKEIKRLNKELNTKFNVLVDEISKKFKGLIDLAIAFGKNKEKQK